MPITTFQDSFSAEVWETTYKDHNDANVDNTLTRIAKAIASVEATNELKEEWEKKFYDLLTNFKGVPGGRIISNAGTEWAGTTLMNCFVGPRGKYDIDSLEGIYSHLLSQSQTLKSEGGWGENFSYIRPRGSFISGIGVETPGSVKYMELFDKASEIITSGSGKKSVNKKAKGKIRKGAMMGVIDVWHPDIIEFITAKQQPGRLTKFNISVNCTDKFMERVNQIDILEKQIANTAATDIETINACNQDIAILDKWDLIFPETTFEKYKSEWDGDINKWESNGYPVKIFNTISVKWLWTLIMESTYNRAEPGVLFLDRANYFNPLNYGETIFATNPSMPAGTLVHTHAGIFPIDSLEGKEFQVKSLDGTWAPAKCRMSGENENLLKINFGKNKSIRSTEQHRWPVWDNRMKRLYKVDAKDLKSGDLIPLNRNERIGIYGDMTLTQDQGFMLGYLIGDGWFTKRKDDAGYAIGFTFNKEEADMAEKIKGILNSMKKDISNITVDTITGQLYIQTSSSQVAETLLRWGVDPTREKEIPDIVWRSNDNFIEGFVDGLLSADGCVIFNTESDSDNIQCSVQLTTSQKTLAYQFAKLLGFAGVHTNVCHGDMPSENQKFPNGKIYHRDNYTRSDVAIPGSSVVSFASVFSISHAKKAKKLKDAVEYLINKSKRSAPARSHFCTEFISVTSIEAAGKEKVWDISVGHNQHVFPTEYCYTGNCGEQTLSPGNICCLGTINLTQFVKADGTDFDYTSIKRYVGYMVRFLDNVNSYSSAPLPEYVESMHKKRRIGLGIMGWGSSLFMMKTRFASAEAGVIRERLMKLVSNTAYETSIDLAIEKGKFEYCDTAKHAEAPFIQQLGLSDDYMNRLRSFGIRNASLLSQQPNGNSSILANVVSGGIEPIFMPEYVRTVIVSSTPEEIAKETPSWSEGAWHETDLFKFVKEGDEEILKGVFNGVTYKIDKNRGLTKEVICEDYGVRFLKKKNEWDSTADWAVTTTNLTVNDHVRDLEGFAKWTDAACSKTCNLPFDYPFEDFKHLYLSVYNTGFIKGFTTYRSGTMTTVLSAKDEKMAEPADEEIILENVKMPTSAPATMKTLKAEGRKWYLSVVWNEQQTRPFALFVHTNNHEKNIVTSNAIERLIDLAKRKGIPDVHINEVVEKASGGDNVSKIARMISLNLRHGVLIKNIVSTLDSIEGVYIGSFLFQIKKFLASFIKDGEVVQGETCQSCGSSNIVFEEGCKKCVNCGSSKCG